jgi:hypothetical protein
MKILVGDSSGATPIGAPAGEVPQGSRASGVTQADLIPPALRHLVVAPPRAAGSPTSATHLLMRQLSNDADLERILRKKDKTEFDQPTTLKTLVIALGKAGMGTHQYAIREATSEEVARVGQRVFGWVSRRLDGELARDEHGRPIIVLTPLALSSLSEAVVTVGHEIAHIENKNTTEEAAERAGQAFLATFRERLKRLDNR